MRVLIIIVRLFATYLLVILLLIDLSGTTEKDFISLEVEPHRRLLFEQPNSERDEHHVCCFWIASH